MTDREQQLLHLVDRARRGVALPAELDALADGLGAMAKQTATAEAKAEAMTRAMESTAADALRHRGCHRELMGQCLRAERAEAAIERVRDLATQWAVLRTYGSAATELRAALDQPQQPPTEAQTCSKHVPDPDSETPLRTCYLPAGHPGWHHDEQHRDHWLPGNPTAGQQQPTT